MQKDIVLTVKVIVKHVERTSDSSKNGVEKVDKTISFLRGKVK